MSIILEHHCPQCDKLVYIEYSNVVNLEVNPELRENLFEGSLNHVICPHCGFKAATDQPFMVNDPVSRQVVFVLPDPSQRSVYEQIFTNVLKVLEPKEKYFENPTIVANHDDLIECLEIGSEDELHSVQDKDAVENWIYLKDFLVSTNWDERKNIIKTHPELYSDKVLIFLIEQMQFAREQDNFQYLQMCRLARITLEGCSHIGIDETINKLSSIIQLWCTENGERKIGILPEKINELDQFEYEVLEAVLLSISKMIEQFPGRLHYPIKRLTDTLDNIILEDETELRAMCQALLGSAYRRFPFGSKVLSLKKALQLMLSAKSFYEKNQITNTLYLSLLNELGLTYMELPADDHTTNINRAVHLFEKVIKSENMDEFLEMKAASHNNLGMAYSRYMTPDWVNTLQKSINYFNMALEIYSAENTPVEYIKTINNLGTVFIKLMDVDTLYANRALECFDKLISTKLNLVENNTAILTIYHINCSQALLKSPSRDNEQRQIEALDNAQKALNLLRESSPITHFTGAHEAMASAYEAPGAKHDLVKAISHLKKALSKVSINTFPHEVRRISLLLGDHYLQKNDWENAELSYENAILAHETLYHAASFDTGRYGQISMTYDLYACSAYALMRLGYIQQAFSRHEQGKTRVMTHYLLQDKNELEKISVLDRKKILNLQEEIRQKELFLQAVDGTWNVSSSKASLKEFDEVAQELKTLRKRRQDLIEDIREKVPDFLLPNQQYQNIFQTIPFGGVLVVPLFTSVGSALFVLPSKTEQIKAEHVLWLDHLFVSDINELLFGTKDSGEKDSWIKGYSDIQETPTSFSLKQNWNRIIKKIGKRLWELILEPLHKQLLEIGLEPGAPVLFIPQGGIGLLPLHAGWREEDGKCRYFIDDWEVTYSPSTQVASICHKRLSQRNEEKKLSVLNVINTQNDLIFADQEGTEIAELFGNQITLRGDDATLACLKRLACDYTYLHFACHGVYNFQDPLSSGIKLAGQDFLDVNEIIEGMDLSNSRLITLSACETGKIDIILSPDEYIGIPAGFLISGSKSVISTLWLVDDFSTMLMMKYFYKKHLQEAFPIAKALREAQLWLRNATRKQLGEYYKSHFRVDNANACNTYNEFMFSGDPNSKPYANPYYWAAFTYTGR